MSKEAEITAAELRAAVAGEMDALIAEVSRALSQARAGAIIADSEEPVRAAMARFRQQVYERGVQVLADKAAKAAFSPSAQPGQRAAGAEQRPAKR
jgi:hypothetical protein